MQILFTALFVIGALFINAAHIPAWFIGCGKPSHSHWKLYGFIGFSIWIVILILANSFLK